VSENYSDYEKLKGLIEELDDYINHYHGGSVNLISFDGKVVRVKLGGAWKDARYLLQHYTVGLKEPSGNFSLRSNLSNLFKD